jgi:hypothetical protein
VRILVIENTLFVSIWLLGIPKIPLANLAIVRNCLSCFDHQKTGFSTSSKGVQMSKNDNSR